MNGGGFRNPLGRLRTEGWIDYAPGDIVALTGRGVAHEPTTPPTTEQLHEDVLATLPGNTHRKILRVVLASYPESTETAMIAARTAASGLSTGPS